MRVPKKGEIWYVDPNPTKGHELRSPHYFIVVSDELLNQALGTAILLPNIYGWQEYNCCA